MEPAKAPAAGPETTHVASTRKIAREKKLATSSGERSSRWRTLQMGRFRTALLTTFLATAVASPASPQESGSAKRPELPGGIYDKPYILRAGRGVALGGYMDHEFEWNEGGANT